MFRNKAFHSIVIHLLVAWIAYHILYYYYMVGYIPNNRNLLQYDGNWYRSIKDNGYEYWPKRGCNLAFFPLFPLWWKLLNVSPLIISWLNAAIFIISFVFLVKSEKTSYSLILFIISIPSFIFFFLPYSESVFFVFGTLILLGYEKKSIVLRCIGFLGSSIARSVCLLFIPLIIICDLILNTQEKNNFPNRLKSALFSIVSCLVGLSITVLMQYHATGKWFYFLTVQQYFKRTWIIPKFPLTTISPDRVLGIDSIAFVIGLLAIGSCIQFFLTTRQFSRKIEIRPSILFSALYLGGITIMDTFFSLNWNGAGNIWSINRHILATPFFVFFILWFATYKKWNLKSLDIIPILIVITCIYITGTYKFRLTLIQYISFFICILIFRFFPKYQNYLILVYAFEVFYQLSFYNDFLKGQWLG